MSIKECEESLRAIEERIDDKSKYLDETRKFLQAVRQLAYLGTENDFDIITEGLLDHIALKARKSVDDGRSNDAVTQIKVLHNYAKELLFVIVQVADCSNAAEKIRMKVENRIEKMIYEEEIPNSDQ